MNLAKSHDFFKPESVSERIHIIGCGSVGSTVAENLARFGLTRFSLYDFDIVNSHNVVNQMFTEQDVGRPKIEALADMMVKINPAIKKDLKLKPEGYTGQKIAGYVFLCVDNIELRKKIAESLKGNPLIKAMFDFRTGLTDAQHYAADWSNPKNVDDFISTMNFTHEEAMAETPMSACNVSLCVAPTVRMISAAGVCNFVNFAKGGALKKMILIDAFSFSMDAI